MAVASSLTPAARDVLFVRTVRTSPTPSHESSETHGWCFGRDATVPAELLGILQRQSTSKRPQRAAALSRRTTTAPFRGSSSAERSSWRPLLLPTKPSYNDDRRFVWISQYRESIEWALTHREQHFVVHGAEGERNSEGSCILLGTAAANLKWMGWGDYTGFWSRGTVPSNQPWNTMEDQRVDPCPACAIWIAD